jgi:outer membrane immunogenic protein
MRRYRLGSIAALILGSVSSAALAADMVAPEPAPIMSWTGFYLGAGGGVDWADFDINHKHCLLYDDVCVEDPLDDYEGYRRSFNESSDGDIIGIVQGGFDWEVVPSFVVGVGADWTFGDGIEIDHRDNNEDNFFRRRWNATVNDMVDVYGRAGFAPPQNLLIFGLVGWTWADVDAGFRIDDGSDVWHANNDDNFNANGISFGGGVEWKFTDNLSVRGEYRFTDLDNFDNNGRFDYCPDACDSFRHRNDIDVDVQRVLFTLNWRFGGFGAASAAAY